MERATFILAFSFFLASSLATVGANETVLDGSKAQEEVQDRLQGVPKELEVMINETISGYKLVCFVNRSSDADDYSEKAEKRREEEVKEIKW